MTQGQATSMFDQLSRHKKLEEIRRRVLFEGGTATELFLLDEIEELTEHLEVAFEGLKAGNVTGYVEEIQKVLLVKP